MRAITTSDYLVAMYSMHRQIIPKILIILSMTVSTTSTPHNSSTFVTHHRHGAKPMLASPVHSGTQLSMDRIRHKASNTGHTPHTRMDSKNQIAQTHSSSMPGLPPPIRRVAKKSIDNSMPTVSSSLNTLTAPTSFLHHLMTPRSNRRSMGIRSSVSQNMLRRLLQDTDTPVKVTKPPLEQIFDDTTVRGLNTGDEFVILTRDVNANMLLDVHIGVQNAVLDIDISGPVIEANDTQNKAVDISTDAWNSDTEIPVRTSTPQILDHISTQYDYIDDVAKSDYIDDVAKSDYNDVAPLPNHDDLDDMEYIYKSVDMDYNDVVGSFPSDGFSGH